MALLFIGSALVLKVTSEEVCNNISGFIVHLPKFSPIINSISVFETNDCNIRAGTMFIQQKLSLNMEIDTSNFSVTYRANEKKK